MKKLLKATLFLLLGLLLAGAVVLGWYFPHYLMHSKRISVTPMPNSITMMSCNVRCLSPLDLGTKSWFYRARLLIDDIAFQAPGIIGFQEATVWQYDYLVSSLPEYDSIITYRDRSFNAEGCPIFYHKDLYELVDKGSFWLSETPDVMSKDWGAACYRICSYVILTEKSSGKDFVVFNTHLDHVSDEARIKGVGVVLEKISQFGGLPAVIMGDFNAREGSKTYESVTRHFADACHAAGVTPSYTFQNWGALDSAKRIDYFMISRIGFTVLDYAVVPAVHDGVYASDHCPIVTTLVLD